MDLETFIARWAASGDAERANKDSFLTELCDVLGVERPRPKVGDPPLDVYVFEKDVARARPGAASTGFVDLYKAGCFLLEAKQGAAAGPKRRDSAAWNQMMVEAHGQALGYAASLDAPPPFLVVCDVGYCFDLYASFDGSGAYRAFPDGQGKRIFLAELPRRPELVERLRAVWTEPHALDPSRRSAAVTREVAGRIAALASELEGAGHDPEAVATFLMRCLFTMFAEDVGLLPGKVFSKWLAEFWLPNPESFPGGVGALWKAMDRGEDFVAGRMLRFNGGLFASHAAPKLTRPQLELLFEAAKSDWSHVDPSIFGTLLERALNPKERHRLGAHYTPRAYVERLVRPTIEEPLRADWDLVRAEVRQLVEAGKVAAAQERVLDFHHALCHTRVLDPACGTGNFLYVTLDLFKRLESEVLAALAELGYAQISLEMEKFRVTPEQFLGIEVKRWAKEIAELVLWIGYLQWQVRQPGGALTVPQPVLRDYGNVVCRDAVLAWDGEPELVRDETGQPVTRWDGETMKASPVTGQEVPDETARVPVFRYPRPRRASWPKADFIVGNPPYIGNKRMRLALGDGYVEALRRAHDDVPETADYVMYWWNQAAERVAGGEARRFGLITTNSITQTFNRKVVERWIGGKVSIVFAVPDHPWVDSVDGAAVRVAMTVGVGEAGVSGKLLQVEREEVGSEDARAVQFRERRGPVNGDLTVGVDTALAVPLRGNLGLGFMGVIPVGLGFRLDPDELAGCGIDPAALPPVVRRYKNGRDVAENKPDRYIIDFFGLSEHEARTSYPALFQVVFTRVKPERDKVRRDNHRERWWIFGEARPGMRAALTGLSRYIATVETSKHRYFVFLDGTMLPDQKLRVIASADAWTLSVLSSRVHTTWATTTGSWMGVGNDPVYNNTASFLPFPFPTCSPAQEARIRDLGEALDAHRKRQQALHPTLTLTGMYNVLEKLRSGEELSAKERAIHEQGLVSVLRQIHDELDAAVFAAYGWPAELTDEEILERLVALNRERAEEEAKGLVRWLRPEFQNPEGARAETQASLAEAGLEVDASTEGVAVKAAKAKWPRDLPGRIVAARDLLAQGRTASAGDLARAYSGAKAAEAEKLLESLAAVGVAIEVPAEGGGAERRWRLLR